MLGEARPNWQTRASQRLSLASVFLPRNVRKMQITAAVRMRPGVQPTVGWVRIANASTARGRVRFGGSMCGAPRQIEDGDGMAAAG